MITSAANQNIKQLVVLRDKAGERSKLGVYIIEGFKMFEEAPLEDISEVYLAEDAIIYADGSPWMHIWDKLKQTGYEQVSCNVFKKITDTQTPQGILAVMRQPSYKLEEIVEAVNPLLLLIEDLQDPGNLGTILRTGEGAGITGVIMSGNTVDIYNPKSIRSTMGSIYRVPFVKIEDLHDIMETLHDIGIHTYASHLNGEAFYDENSYRGPTAFLIGNEGRGLRDRTMLLAKSRIRIPMEGKVESLNASVAAALLMYEGYRQRKIGDVNHQAVIKE